MSLHEDAKIHEEGDITVAFGALPDEMLVQIFSILDSVTRQGVERVCRRWQSVLRDTHPLRTCIFVDVTRIATPLKQRRGVETVVKRICRTIATLLHHNPLAETLHMSGESDVTEPGLTTGPMSFKQPGMSEFMTELTLTLDKGRNPSIAITTVILDKLTLLAWDVQHFIQELPSKHGPIRHLELRNVLVVHFSLVALTSRYHRVIGGAECRSIIYEVLTFDKNGLSAFSQWIMLLGSGEPPLTADEEVTYQKCLQAPAVYYDRATELQIEFFVRYFRRELNMDCGNAYPTLIKRLIVSHSASGPG